MIMKKLLAFIYVVLTFFFLVGCNKESAQKDIGGTWYKVFADDYHDGNPRDICLSKEQLFYKNEYFLGKEQHFFEVTEDEMCSARNLLENHLDSCQCIKDDIKPRTIDNYFRQYFGYKENGHNYIYINLCAFFRAQHPKLYEMGYMSDSYLYSILSSPERGYAGHVIIDKDNSSVVEFNFEKYPDSKNVD